MSSFDCTSPAHLAVEKSDYIVLVKESETTAQSVLNGSGCYLLVLVASVDCIPLTLLGNAAF